MPDKPRDHDTESDERLLDKLRRARQESNETDDSSASKSGGNAESNTWENPPSPLPETIPTDDPSRPPQRIDPYTILEVLGEGGMGTVYLAEQTAPVRRRVALKVIKRGMDTKQVIARFEVERQALAMMDHPNVAKVFDAGTTEDGRPFFAMEHVAGLPITEHCDRHRLSIDERLKLFMQACQAVQHAHQKGIIHRDIKPSNILVAFQDAQAVPKVIDFGVAKALSQRLTEKTLFTEQGQLIGTPEYMSPEQAEMTAQDIDTRSDIYSLGVLLYELLTGALPFDPQSLRRAAFGEIQRIIREEEAPKPSTRISGLGDASTSSAKNRRLDTRSLLRELRGDLDWIVMKCLEKDRTRRYETANALGADLHRHLSHEPVVAGPPSVRYRTRKFIRRNRGLVVSAATVFVVLVAGIVSSTVFAVGQSRAREEAEQARAKAETEADKAKQIQEFLQDMIASADPQRGKGYDTRVREILDAAAIKVESELQDQPEVEAAIRHTIGVTYSHLGFDEQAKPHLRKALAIRRRILGGEHLDVAETMRHLSLSLYNQGSYDEAMALSQEALVIRRKLLGDDHVLTLDVLSDQAQIEGDLGDRSRSDDLSAQWAAIVTGNLVDTESFWEDVDATLAKVRELWSKGKRREAEVFLQEAVAPYMKVLGPNEYIPAALIGAVADALKVKDYSLAEPLYREALTKYRDLYGEQHLSVASCYAGLGYVLWERNEYAAAERHLRNALKIERKLLGDEHTRTLRSIRDLGNVLQVQGKLEEAEQHFREALDGCRRVLGDDHPATLTSMHDLASLYSDQGRYDEAQPLLVKTLEVQRRVLGPEHPETLRSLTNLVAVLRAEGKSDEARGYVRELLALRKKGAEREGADANAMNAYAWQLLTCEPPDLRDPAAALSIAQEAVKETGGKNLYFLDTLALAYFMTGDTTQAIETEEKALSLLPPGDSPTRQEFEKALARFRGGAGGESTITQPAASQPTTQPAVGKNQSSVTTERANHQESGSER